MRFALRQRRRQISGGGARNSSGDDEACAIDDDQRSDASYRAPRVTTKVLSRVLRRWRTVRFAAVERESGVWS